MILTFRRGLRIALSLLLVTIVVALRIAFIVTIQAGLVTGRFGVIHLGEMLA
jgi:hypothetical protein